MIHPSGKVPTKRGSFKDLYPHKIPASVLKEVDMGKEVARMMTLLKRSENDENLRDEVNRVLLRIRDQAYSKGLRDMDMLHAKVDLLIKIDEDGANLSTPGGSNTEP